MATSAARIATKGRRRGTLEDAKQEAFLLLLSGAFPYDPTRPAPMTRKYLIRRVSGAIIRKRQNAEGARLKNKPVWKNANCLQDVVDYKNDPAIVAEERDEKRRQFAALAEALNNLKPRDRAIICDYLNGTPWAKTAERFGLSSRRLSKIKTRFKKLARAIYAAQTE